MKVVFYQEFLEVKSECFLFYVNAKIEVSKVYHLHTLNAHACTDSTIACRPTVSVHISHRHDQHLPPTSTPHCLKTEDKREGLHTLQTRLQLYFHFIISFLFD